MIRHTVFFSLRPDAPPDKVAALLDEYARFPALHPGMRRFSIGRNISERDQTFDWAFSVEFESETELKAYLNSDLHEEHVTQRFRPIVSRRAIVSYVVA